ncbi:hypothetical protein [Streptomyces sp. NPDC020742]|uniref:hypothetical protein n=1 Tax=Streptomyces sp. NPDC020742 TaxID=3154897 RepID=UPI0033E29ECE
MSRSELERLALIRIAVTGETLERAMAVLTGHPADPEPQSPSATGPAPAPGSAPSDQAAPDAPGTAGVADTAGGPGAADTSGNAGRRTADRTGAGAENRDENESTAAGDPEHRSAPDTSGRGRHRRHLRGL